MEKGVFIGPRGGKWADAAHTIPWQPLTNASGAESKRTGALPVHAPRVDSIAEFLMSGVKDDGWEITDLGEPASKRIGWRMMDRSDTAVTIQMQPKELKDPRGISGHASLVKLHNGKTEHVVSVHLDPKHFVGKPKDYLRTAIRSVLVHELTHVADPEARAPSDSHDHSGYMNEKVEVTARMNQIMQQLHEPATAEFIKTRPSVSVLGVLGLSDTWQHMQGHLNEKNRQRVYQMVSRVIDKMRGSAAPTDDPMKKSGT